MRDDRVDTTARGANAGADLVALVDVVRTGSLQRLVVLSRRLRLFGSLLDLTNIVAETALERFADRPFDFLLAHRCNLVDLVDASHGSAVEVEELRPGRLTTTGALVGIFKLAVVLTIDDTLAAKVLLAAVQAEDLGPTVFGRNIKLLVAVSTTLALHVGNVLLRIFKREMERAGTDGHVVAFRWLTSECRTDMVVGTRSNMLTLLPELAIDVVRVFAVGARARIVVTTATISAIVRVAADLRALVATELLLTTIHGC